MAHTIGRRRRAGLALVASGVFALIGAITTPAFADQPADPGANAPGQTGERPAGNNGTLKVDGHAVDQPGSGDKNPGGQGHRDNEPHVTCQFNLDWYGYEAGNGTTNVSFELWGPNKGYALTPSGGGSVVDLEDDAAGNAEDQDKTQTYDLSAALAAAKTGGAEPNAQQGWQVKVTVETDGLSHGADVKHKVFWVEDNCSNPSRPQGCVANCSPLVLGQVVTTTTTTTTVPPTTAPPAIAAPTTAPPQVLGVQLARTGAGTATLLAAAGLLLVGGGTAMLAGRRGSAR